MTDFLSRVVYGEMNRASVEQTHSKQQMDICFQIEGDLFFYYHGFMKRASESKG